MNVSYFCSNHQRGRFLFFFPCCWNISYITLENITILISILIAISNLNFDLIFFGSWFVLLFELRLGLRFDFEFNFDFDFDCYFNCNCHFDFDWDWSVIECKLLLLLSSIREGVLSFLFYCFCCWSIYPTTKMVCLYCKLLDSEKWCNFFILWE